ncbi:hypothetical protein COE81_12335 [Bacillus wiedmannii]|uniref:hypothetical protein n=1 Tax=Bacillus wiedmannii TaxID=1890302 RepID=UPI000BEF2C74|nr:hypothetical protein [Bacillus wiedmannii]PEI63012.1 hypothetical protein CN646_27900 [Bacillus wiedmannii]PHB07629.1 hypothetical protein COE81_12335 [Bacillus wiedmannii]PHG77748.1 hypothetical protein COI50_12800 [Bacillus wiedmannii]
MNSDDIKLNTKEKFHLGIEACLQLIPTIGGTISTSFYGYQKEKKLKRLEAFYNELAENMEELKLSKNTSSPDMEELLSIIESLNDKVEREHLKEKIDYFKTYFINNISHTDRISYDNKKFFLDILANMTLIECNSILHLYNQFERVNMDSIISGATSKFQKLGAIHRLQSYGFIEIEEEFQTYFNGKTTREKYIVITDYGIKFVQFCLKKD